MKKALFAGSFNPLHEGHIKIIEKSLRLFDFLYVVITLNPDKTDNQNLEQRFEIASQSLSQFKNIKILINADELTANLAKKLGTNYLIRSGRDNFDFEYELQLAAGNKSLNPELETIILFPDLDTIGYSSTLERHKKYFKKEH